MGNVKWGGGLFLVGSTAEGLQMPFEREGKPLPYGSVGDGCFAPPNVCKCRSNGRFMNRPYGSVGEISPFRTFRKPSHPLSRELSQGERLEGTA